MSEANSYKNAFYQAFCRQGKVDRRERRLAAASLHHRCVPGEDTKDPSTTPLNQRGAE
jgi:hypothetical protein